MRRCSYCGAEYPDDAVRCAVDHEALESNGPSTGLSQAESEVAEQVQSTANQEAEDVVEPEYFRCLWRIDTFDAERVMKQFTDAGIRFLTKPAATDQRRRMFFGNPPMPYINIYVHLDDKEKAIKILAADWKS